MKKQSLVAGIVLVGVAALALAQPPRRQGPPRGGQPGVVKPEMSDTIKATIYADNWFAMYINGRLVAVDPIDFLPHNVVTVDILPEYPMTIAIVAKDNADPKTGYEYGDHIGDGGFILKFSDGTVSNASWKVKTIFSGPPVKYESLPDGWFKPGFDDSTWASATEFTEQRVNPKKPYFEHDFSGATFLWSHDLDTDNTILLRTTIQKPGWKPRWTTKPDLDTSGYPGR